MTIRQTIKRFAPEFARDAFIAARAKFSAPPMEQMVLHDYTLLPDPAPESRLTLVIPSLASKSIFGGVSTGVDFLFACAQALNTPIRIIIDEFSDAPDFSYIARIAKRFSRNFDDIEIVNRTAGVQPVAVRKNDIFIAYNWWTALNLRSLLTQQTTCFDAEKPRPLLYIVQEYEPAFYAMSSTHMLARAALGMSRTFGIFNSHELHNYFRAQGHTFEREFVIPLRLSRSLKDARRGEDTPKENTILVYGRPNVPRNCFPSVIDGLKAFVRCYPDFHDWRIESAGAEHDPVALGSGKVLAPLGKLSLDQYARKLESAGVGLSLMSSPHPSYPPLEMAHFGVRTVTNGFACKDLSKAHENIVSIENILPETIAGALASQCRAVLADREGGWRGKSMLSDYFSDNAYPFMKDLVEAVEQESP
jgi:O-antigen biosynthesis protein